MRPSKSSAMYQLCALVAFLASARANPLALEAIESDLSLQNSSLARRCENPCGYYGQVCCAWNQPCYTDSNNEAQCGAATTAIPAGTSGYWQLYTTVFIETDTEKHTTTKVYSSFIPSPAGPTTPVSTETIVEAKCNWNAGESTCGNICCPAGQYCVVDGQCSGNTRTVTKTASQTPTPAPPLRPTSSGISTITQTFATTTTVPFLAPMSTGQTVNITDTGSTGSSSSLSGGAIAGIVIAVIVGILLLLLLCAFFCFKAIWDSILAIFGLGKHRRRETIIEESIHRSSRGDREWYGDRPSRVEKVETKRSYWAPMTAGLGGLATALGMKQRNERKKRRVVEEKDVYSVEDDVSYSRDSRTFSEESESIGGLRATSIFANNYYR